MGISEASLHNIFIDSITGIKPENLEGFFVGWPNSPTSDMLYEILKNSDEFIVAYDKKTNKVVGFITAITDGVLSAFIPLIEILPSYQNRGIGKELMKRMLEKLKDFYAIDTICDENLKSFYSQFGMKSATAMIIRNYKSAIISARDQHKKILKAHS